MRMRAPPRNPRTAPTTIVQPEDGSIPWYNRIFGLSTSQRSMRRSKDRIRQPRSKAVPGSDVTDVLDYEGFRRFRDPGTGLVAGTIRPPGVKAASSSTTSSAGRRGRHEVVRVDTNPDLKNNSS